MEFWIDILNQGLIIAIFAVSLNVILGVAGQLSIAPAGLGGVGGFLAAYLSLKHGWSFLPAMTAGVAAAGGAGMLLGLPSLRLGFEYLLLLTLAFATIIVAVFLAIPALGGQYGLIDLPAIDFGGPTVTASDYLPLIALVTAIAVALCWRLSASPFGRVLRGIREDPDAVAAMGKNVVSYKLTTFTWTAAIQGMGGVMLVYYAQVAAANQFSFAQTTVMVAAVVIGGTGSLFGSFVGALLLTAVGPLLQKGVDLSPETASQWQLVIYGFLLILIMRVRPQGLIPEGASLFRRHRRVTAMASPGPSPAPQLRVVRETEEDDRSETAQPSSEPALVASGLSKSFGGIQAVKDLDLTLPTGRLSALIGPNGAGKTTVFNLITGRIRPDTGRVVLHGRDVTGLHPHQVAALGMARSFQDVRTLMRLSLVENVMLGIPGQPGEHVAPLFTRPMAVVAGERRARDAAMEYLGFVGLRQRADEPAASLSYGDQKLLALARLLASGADVLLIDEPAAGIDRSNLEPVLEVIEQMRAKGKTICLVEHNIDVVSRLADHVLFMEQGQVSAEGTMDEIRQQDRLAEVYFGRGDRVGR